MPVDSARLAVDAPVLAVIFGHGNPAPVFERIVYFGFRKVVPRDPKSVRRIAAAIDQFRSVGGLQIDGFTDAIGKKPYNKRLSIRRACAVARELAQLLAPAVPPIGVRAFGETHPAASNTRDDGSDDPIGRARNRRVDVKVLDRPLQTRIFCGRRQ
jgi:outer membrane protein OmpA-like peptidoglycan-associated protein